MTSNGHQTRQLAVEVSDKASWVDHKDKGLRIGLKSLRILFVSIPDCKTYTFIMEYDLILIPESSFSRKLQVMDPNLCYL